MRGLRFSKLAMCAMAVAPAFAQGQRGPSESVSIAPSAQAYLEEAIALFRKWHIHAAQADWAVIRAKSYAAARGAKTTSDTYPAIRIIIKELGERHTFFVDPDSARAQSTGTATGAAAAPTLVLAEVTKLANGVGFVRLYGFSGSDEQARHYVEYARTRIAKVRDEGVCRFILDLRANTGGNMYPMLSALNSFLDDGSLGTFEYVDAGRKTYWGLKDGAGIETLGAIAASSVRKAETFPVAVLLGPRTASSGEYTAMAFKGRPNTRFFGSATGGYVTSNETLKLSDGAIINIAAAWGSDRTGKKYFDVVQPDEATGHGGPTIDAATDWLLRQPCIGRQLTRDRR